MRRSLTLALLPLAATLIGCGPRQVGAEDRQAIEEVLASYAQVMSEAYRSEDVRSLAAIATVREQTRVERAIAELAGEGKRLQPTLQRLVVESVEPSGNTSVLATTLEVWDLTVVALGSGVEVSQSLAQENHLTYSLVREKGRWLVLSRALRTTQPPS